MGVGSRAMWGHSGPFSSGRLREHACMRRRGRGLAWRASTRGQALGRHFLWRGCEGGRRRDPVLKLRSLVRIRVQVEAVEFMGQLQQSAPN